MGMYTELHYNVELRGDTPPEVINTPSAMIHGSDLDTTPNHALFRSGRWKIMLLSDSYYFAADTHSTLRHDDVSGTYYLCVRCNLKNYDGEIEKFIDWINPWVRATEGDFLGFSRYEETEEPTIIRKA